MEDRVTVEKISAWIPVSDEMVVDYGIGTPEQIAESSARLEMHRQEDERRWRALPWYVRFARSFRFWRWSVQDKAMRRLHAALFPDHDQ